MIVYFDTVRRKRPVKEGGELVKLDWSTKEVLNKIPVYPTDPDIVDDPNPRGNSRGGKGIVISGDTLYVGSYHTILAYDSGLNLQRRITNNLFVGIHEMCLSGDDIWVSSTAVDCALLVDREGRTIKSWWPREEPLLQRSHGFFPMDIDKNADNRIRHIHAELSKKESHTHLNGVVCFGGRVYALLNRPGLVVQIEPEIKVVLEDEKICGSHSPVVVEGGSQIALCSSFEKTILFYDIQKGRLAKEIPLLDFDVVAKLHRDFPDQPFNKSIFVRGMEVIDSRRILAGISPASILEIDVYRKELLDFYQYSSDVGDAVHGLAHTRGMPG
ncbi:MAG: hypothetical protein JXB23_14670 [Candidatus Aminicenantes bacterium]|nr:hypothetical protein [Candidatus Aminicenantes bacterium]